ncbi:DNA-binding transcriptional regulator, MarR family [Franzmannia pantelleriensis]|uniref:DNA-binding transcriptional regulator, MarR family n=1 Tax=Franzmannia pantelleriensis TaxID=48727 RepID=A0A1G9H689_9GAMM|nr:MarR family winged helix-turn-helix transcriptional regulator [Halomonas pantelleriensis]SDL08274.1 DNA-binding transcriptional regulator, MarR family [Halomonas pantelleriensis]
MMIEKQSKAQGLNLSNRVAMRRALSVVQLFRELQSDLPLQTASLFVHIAANPGISIKQLIEETGGRQATISRTISVLSKWQEVDKPGFGLVWTKEDPHERRRKLVFLTDKGEEFAAELADIIR